MKSPRPGRPSKYTPATIARLTEALAGGNTRRTACLFPVFGRARGNSRRSSCQSNEKQIGMACLQYEQDNDEITVPRWMGSNVYYYNGTQYTGEQWYVILQPYVKSAQVFWCPSIEGLYTSGSYIATSYGYNETGLTSNLGGVALAKIQNVAQTVMLAKTDEVNNNASPPYNSPNGPYWDAHIDNPSEYSTPVGSQTNPPSPPANQLNGVGIPLPTDPQYYTRPSGVHFNGCNVCFVDGHVKWLLTTEFYYGQIPTDAWFTGNHP